jgi:DNA sulfur modification protein DndE
MTSIESVRVTERARDQLLTLKRRTGIKNWNTLCRWAFCASLSDERDPPEVHGRQDELMDWQTFGGPHSDVYLALLKSRCMLEHQSIDAEMLRGCFHRHLHHGIVKIVSDKSIRSPADLVTLKTA